MPKFDTAWMESVGPPWDVVCGTAGASTDLNALVAAGHRRIVLADGAILTAALTLSAAQGFIWCPRAIQSLYLGAFGITVTGSTWHLEGFGVNGAPGVGFALQSAFVSLHRIAATNCGSHGIEFGTQGQNHVLMDSMSFDNTGDGLHTVASGPGSIRVTASQFANNTGWGVNDLGNNTNLVANRIISNTAGIINGTPNIDVGNEKIA